MTLKEDKLKQIIDGIIERAVSMKIESNVPFDDEQKSMLEGLNVFCVSHVLNDVEISRDPRKIVYKASEEFKTALTAICLSQALTNPNRRNWETREFFIENIGVATEGDVKYLEFGKIEPQNVLDAIHWDVIEDWKIFRDKTGYGIKSLIDEKTNLAGLAGYRGGGDILYEFARFQRKYTEKEKRKEQRARESAQEAFRNGMAHTLAVEMTKQQLLEGKNPMEMLEMLFAPEKNKREIRKVTQKVDPKIEQDVTRLLEDKS